MSIRLLGDLVERERRSSDPALAAPDSGRSYAYRDFCTTAYKAGNVLRYLGVDRGDRVVVRSDSLPEPVFALLGAAQLGAAVAFDAGPQRVRDGEFRAVVVSADREAAFDTPPGCNLAVYGGSPDDPSTTHWEAELWSENPAFPPTEVSPDDAVLVADGDDFSHAAVVAAAEGVVADAGVDDGTTVAVRASLEHPGTVAAGVVAPLLAGGELLFPDADATGDVAVADAGDDAPEPVVVSPDAVRFDRE